MDFIDLPRTKIVATLGPASDSRTKIAELIKAGVSVFRFNMKHGSVAEAETRMRRVRAVAQELDRPVAILMDLQGPEVRLGELAGEMRLKGGEVVWFGGPDSANHFAKATRGTVIPIDNLAVLKGLKKGQRVLVDDGLLVFEVMQRVRIGGKERVKAKVVEGGVLKSRKGVNLPGMKLDIPVLVKRDIENLSLANKAEVDWIALSFVRGKGDIDRLRRELGRRGIKAGVIAKIERQEALDNFEEVLKAADGIMVARGDLGVEVPVYEVPFWQKLMIRRCREVGKPVITATQMLQSMVESPLPTRAEISDVANAIYDRTDAVMLSGETASGKYPVKAVEVMASQARFIEGKLGADQELEFSPGGQTGAVVKAAKALMDSGAEALSAIVVLTESGETARLLSRLRPRCKILAVAHSREVRDKLCLVWGVRPFYFGFKPKESEESVQEILKFLQKKGAIKRGEKVLMTYGDVWGQPGATSVLRVHLV